MTKKTYCYWTCSILLILLTSLWSQGCRKLVAADNDDDGGDPSGEGAFAAYILKDWRIGVTPLAANGVDALVQQTQTLALENTPLFTADDIVSYNWTDQLIYFSDAAAARLSSYGLNAYLAQAVPVVVTVDDERIYLGVIWPLYWTPLPNSPYFTILEATVNIPYHMSVTALDSADKTLITDPRIYNSLWKAGLLN